MLTVSDALEEKMGLRGREKALKVKGSRMWSQRRGLQCCPGSLSTVDGAKIGFNVLLLFKVHKHI